MTNEEKYRGIPLKEEIRCAANDLLSNETARAVGLFLDGWTAGEVADAVGRTKKVTFDMKVAENIVATRLIHVTPTAVRRTERACRQMLKSSHLGLNSRRGLEYLRDRALEHGW